MYILSMTVCNRAETGGINHLDTTLSSLRASGLWDSGVDFVLLLHDTGSKDQSYLDKYIGQAKITVVKPKEKLGQQDNMVAMLQYVNDNFGGSKDDYVLFLEDDILFCDNFISNLDIWVKKHITPDDVLQSFYIPYNQSAEAIAKGIDDKFLLRHFYGAQALGFGYHRLASLLSWLKASRGQNGHWTALNDLLIRAWVETFGKPTMKVSAPSMTQHINTGSSLHTPTHQSPSFTGKDPCLFTEGITVFSVPKPFNEKYKVIQRNAICSWLNAGCNVILLGDELGVAEISKELNLRHIRELEKSPQGTPYLDSIFSKARRAAGTRLLCYSNADMVFPENLSDIYKLIKFDKFLMVGNRHGIDQTEPIDFENKGWHSEMLARSKQKEGCFMDYFCFPKALAFTMPKFVLGRPLWDQWLLYHFADVLKLPILNVNEVFKALHQNHDYLHIEKGTSTGGGPWTGPECDHNYKIFGNTPLKQIGDCTTHTLRGGDVQLVPPASTLPSYSSSKVPALIIQHHKGLGDHIICNGMVRELVKETAGTVILFCQENNVESVRFMYRDIPQISIMPFLGEESATRTFMTFQKQGLSVRKIGFSMDWDSKTTGYAEQFYRLAGLPYWKRWTSFKVVRDRDAEQRLKDRLKLPKDYIFVHGDGSDCGYVIDEKRIETGGAVIVRPTKDEKILFNWTGVIEGAKEIHCIDSSFLCYVDSLDLPQKKVYHRYARKMTYFMCFYQPQRDWTILN